MKYCPLHARGIYIIFWKLCTRYESINLPIAMSQPKVICSSLCGSLVFGTSSWFSRIFVCAEHFNFFFLRVLSLTRFICMSLLWLSQILINCQKKQKQNSSLVQCIKQQLVLYWRHKLHKDSGLGQVQIWLHTCSPALMVCRHSRCCRMNGYRLDVISNCRWERNSIIKRLNYYWHGYSHVN